jgi:hypothetical protein
MLPCMASLQLRHYFVAEVIPNVWKRSRARVGKLLCTVQLRYGRSQSFVTIRHRLGAIVNQAPGRGSGGEAP